jgi:hypothetical protein
VCGKDLSEVSAESEDEIQNEQNTDVRVEMTKESEAIRKIEKGRLTVVMSELVSGVASLILGIVIIGQYHSLYGVVLVLLGLGLVAHAIALPIPGRWGYGRRF